VPRRPGLSRVNATWPFAELRVFGDRVELRPRGLARLLLPAQTLKLDAIEAVERLRRGVQFLLKNRTHEPLYLRTRRGDEVLATMEQLGVSVDYQVHHPLGLWTGARPPLDGR
jgi:hypothetical protein